MWFSIGGSAFSIAYLVATYELDIDTNNYYRRLFSRIDGDGRRLAAGNLLDGDSSLVFNEEDGLGFKSRLPLNFVFFTLYIVI